MIRCRRCKQHFMSITAYGIHTWMVQEIGPHKKKVCPTEAALKAQGMSRFAGQWVFLSAEEQLKLPPEDRSTREALYQIGEPGDDCGASNLVVLDISEVEHAERDC